MATSTLRNTQYSDLGETWYGHQVARIVQRHLQFGQHGQLDLETLIAGAARTINRPSPDKVAGDRLPKQKPNPVNRCFPRRLPRQRMHHGARVGRRPHIGGLE
jgi:hypothetical protein